jgi:hypothetical protein
MGMLNWKFDRFRLFLNVVKNLVVFFHGLQVWRALKNAKNRCSAPAHTGV